MPLLHWVQSGRRPSENHRSLPRQTLFWWWRQAPATSSLCPSVLRTLPTIHEIPTPHPCTAPRDTPRDGGQVSPAKGNVWTGKRTGVMVLVSTPWGASSPLSLLTYGTIAGS